MTAHCLTCDVALNSLSGVPQYSFVLLHRLTLSSLLNVLCSEQWTSQLPLQRMSRNRDLDDASSATRLLLPINFGSELPELFTETPD